MEKPLIGTPSETGGAARAAALVVLAAMTVFAGAALITPAAQAAPQTVCCFRITVEVAGEAQAQYTRVDPIDDQGRYFYKWDGTAYGLAHLRGSQLLTDRGVAAGYLAEQNEVTDREGRPRDRNDPGCSQGEQTGSGRYEVGKTRHGSPKVGGGIGFAFSRPFEQWALNCLSLATETFDKLEEGNAVWAAPHEFFYSTRLPWQPSARKLAKGRTQEVTCVEHSRPPAEPRMRALGFYTVMIKIVPFPADDLKHQQHRLAGFLGDRRDPDYYPHRPIDKLADPFFLGKHAPGNGCRKG